MKIRILAFGQRMPGWIDSGADDYLQRMSGGLRVSLTSLPLEKRSKAQSLDKIRQREDAKMLSSVKPDECVIALDQRGKQWSTEGLAASLRDWQMSGRDYCLLIGGPEGLGANSLARADIRWSLAQLTLPHPLVRIIVLEQLYRAWTINTGHPYHR
ncbi:MAG: 23S rRNA (pseudouridine(1915)-N(3))-methyltransferase RlmH [Pseudomonadales bacterium]